MHFFYRTGTKIAGAVLCLISLTTAFLCGLLILLLLDAGTFDSGRSPLDSLAMSQMYTDANSIMMDYFDPSEPNKPWASYYVGGVYTGEGSNLRYTITDASTGKAVLSTYDNEPVYMQQNIPYSFSVPDASAASESLVVTGLMFRCAGSYYLYNDDLGAFLLVTDSRGQSSESVEQLSKEALSVGFCYPAGGPHYSYAFEDGGEGFYPDDASFEDTGYVTNRYTITCYLLSGFPYQDPYQAMSSFSERVTSLRFWLVGLGCGGLLLSLVLLVYLGCAVGRIPGQTEPVLGPIYRLPPDLAGMLCLILGGYCLAVCASFFSSIYLSAICSLTGLLLLGFSVSLMYCILMLCVRIKTHSLLQGCILYQLFRLLGRSLSRLGRGLGRSLGYLPLLWKVLVCYGILCLVEFIALSSWVWYSNDLLFLLWLGEKLVLGALVGYVTLCFRRLKNGAEAIAAGDYSTKVKEEHLVMDFKSAADTLNHIQDGMNAAVDSRTRSERLKAELITNVSHDLKTPLTSIVSYVSLLKQEPAGSQAAQEYLEVLDRQSMRLKKLIEDLVEASKASTGNLNLQLEVLDFNMLLGQAMGEYAQRLTGAELTPIIKIPEEPAMVRADGRRLWRVFDNLLGNAVKYAMPGTRLYLTVESGASVTATFRNVSREPLEVSAEDLMERFVRGDASRHTEGSGLGLSIARSLTESMGGSFGLELDGDLFKAIVTFPLLPRAFQDLP